VHSYITIFCCIVIIWLFVCFSLGNPMPKPLFEDFEEQVFEDSEILFSRQ
jgi:hypothetical protein